MDMKTCRDCKLPKPVDQFYRNKRMADGRYPACASCTRQYNHAYYDKNSAQFVEYRKRWFSAPGYKEKAVKFNQKYRRLYPEKYKARTAVFNAVATGKLKKLPCEICGATAEAHHTDYSKPLTVQWLCRKHHEAEHKELSRDCTV